MKRYSQCSVTQYVGNNFYIDNCIHEEIKPMFSKGNRKKLQSIYEFLDKSTKLSFPLVVAPLNLS